MDSKLATKNFNNFIPVGKIKRLLIKVIFLSKIFFTNYLNKLS